MIKLIKIEFAFEDKDVVFSFMDKLDELRTEYGFIYNIDNSQKEIKSEGLSEFGVLTNNKSCNVCTDSSPSDTHTKDYGHKEC